MFDYSSNSNKSKKETGEKQKNLKSVVTKSPTIRKKSGLYRFASRFLPVDLNDIGRHVFDEYVVPSIGNTLVDTISYIFNLNRGSSKKNYSGASYRNYYEGRYTREKDKDDDPPVRKDTLYEYEDFIFDYKQDALAALEEMENVLDEYPSVSIADLYDILDMSNDNYQTNKFGWTDISRAEVIRARGGGYKLKLPRARHID